MDSEEMSTVGLRSSFSYPDLPLPTYLTPWTCEDDVG